MSKAGIKSLSYFIQVAAFLLFLTAAAFCQPAQQPHETCGKPANGIALCLSPSEERNGIILEIKNTGPKDALLNLGIMLDTGQKQYPNAIQLLVVDSEGKQHYAELAEPTWIGGRVDPLFFHCRTVLHSNSRFIFPNIFTLPPAMS